MFRRVILTRRFSPRATSPTRSLHSLRDLSVGEIRDTAVVWVTASMAGAVVGWIHDNFMKGRGVDQSAVKPVDLQASEEEECRPCRPAVKLLDVQATKEEESRPDVKRADTRATKAAA